MCAYRKPKTINPEEVDPSVYYYDEVYDEMQHAKDGDHDKSNKRSKEPQKSKYIQGIIETAERRKSEKEIRKFKKFAQDREEAQASGDIDDADVYITNSYKRKLEEMQEVLQKHSQRDDDQCLNSFKRAKSTSDTNEASSKQALTVTETTSSPRSVPKELCEKTQITTEHNLEVQNPNPQSSSQDTNKKKKLPKTIEERREYLKEVLAKRTVGKVFEAALERYRQRKSNTQHG